MARPVVRLAVVVTLGFLTAGVAGRKQDSGLVVHEWGTFTTVAGEDGAAVQWLPLGGPVDLPCFVNHFQNYPLLKYGVGAAGPLTYDQARAALQGTVRMETPVLYFYTPRATEVDVSVRFPHGLMTEWYPKATVTQAIVTQATGSASVRSQPGQSVIRWTGVKIRPDAVPVLPTEAAPSHYYAARQTDASPVQVTGQDEKFLFYRGVGAFEVPLSTVLTSEGRVLVANRGGTRLSNVVLFENRGGRIGYRVHGEVRTPVTLDPPSLTADFASLQKDLERMLVATGLYDREAHAMVETWRDSWFEEGTRVFYIIRGAAVDAILPLTITPAPARVTRAFVGRMEIITPETMCAVRDGIAQADEPTLTAYGRFLGPIADRLLATATAAERARTQAVLADHYKSYLTRAASACK